MKMIYGNVPVKSLNLNYFERNTNDCDMIASDLQAGKTGVARGEKITGTGKSFSFAYYGRIRSNDSLIIPINAINVVQISSLDYPVQLTTQLVGMWNLDFSSNQVIGNLIIDDVSHPISVSVQNNELMVTCDVTAYFEIFFGKDNYV